MASVLVVDDEEGFLQIIQVVLRRAGYKTLLATDGAQALDMVYNQRPDIVILDDMMPGMSGGDICMHLKNDPEISSTIVLMHSAGAKVRNPTYIKQIGADGVLYKPSLPTEIIETVNSFLEVRAG